MEREAKVFVVDDDALMRETLASALQAASIQAEFFASAGELLDAYSPVFRGCILLDIRMPEMDGAQLYDVLIEKGCQLPIIFITAFGDVPTAVRAVKKGAYDFIEKPFELRDFLDLMRAALRFAEEKAEHLTKYETLTPREKEVFHLLAEGYPNKSIARRLVITVRTVESHRKNLSAKLDAGSVSDLIRLSTEIVKSP
jgi:two-component system, LuxR family, response regulator FixJ